MIYQESGGIHMAMGRYFTVLLRSLWYACDVQMYEVTVELQLQCKIQPSNLNSNVELEQQCRIQPSKQQRSNFYRSTWTTNLTISIRIEHYNKHGTGPIITDCVEGGGLIKTYQEWEAKSTNSTLFAIALLRFVRLMKGHGCKWQNRIKNELWNQCDEIQNWFVAIGRTTMDERYGFPIKQTYA